MAKTFLEQLGAKLPIVQAPMAGVSTPELAAAVTNGGGLGSLGIAAMTVARASEEITKARTLTSGPLNVNLFCHPAPVVDLQRHAAWLAYLAPHFVEAGSVPPEELELLYPSFEENDEMHAMLLDIKPAVVSFHFGLPSERKIRALRSAGIRLMATATNVQEAYQIAADGLDAIVAQGYEAGGHRGTFDDAARDEQLPTSVLVRLLARQQTLPIIAAGGIMDGVGIAASLKQGAQAAQLGTAFVSCPESAASAAYRNALREGASTGTTMTRAISGRAARGLVNQFTKLGGDPECPAVPEYPLAYFVGKALHAAATRQGIAAYAAHWAGQGVAMTRWMDAPSLVSALAEEINDALRPGALPP